MAQALIGANFAANDTTANAVTYGHGPSKLGSRSVDSAGNEWIYVVAGAAIPQYNVVTVRASGTATPFSSAAVAGGANAALAHGISASASIAVNNYGWVMTRGHAAVKVCASSTGTISGALYACASANAGLVQTTASGGQRLLSLFAAATATTSTTGSTVPVIFSNLITTA